MPGSAIDRFDAVGKAASVGQGTVADPAAQTSPQIRQTRQICRQLTGNADILLGCIGNQFRQANVAQQRQARPSNKRFPTIVTIGTPIHIASRPVV